MGGKSGGDPKMPVTRYYLSGHWGVCQTVDVVRDIRVGEKIIWRGMARTNGTITVAREGLFGGMKKEGGVKGGIDVMLGGDDQVPPKSLLNRLKTATSRVPGFRGVTSLVFYGGPRSSGDLYGEPLGGDGGNDYGTVGSIFGLALTVFSRLAYRSSAFYWGTQPYLKPVAVTVQRVPGTQLDAATAPILRGSASTPTSVYFELDDSGSMHLDANGNEPSDPSLSRTASLKSAVKIVLEQIATQIIQGQRVDVGISLFNAGKLEFVRATPEEVQTLIDFVDGYTDDGGATPFDAPIADAVNWFEATRNDTELVKRVNFFITDGEPNPVSSDDAAASLAAELLDRTIPVDMYGVNIDLPDVSATAKLHNQPGDVPVVDSDGDATVLAGIFTAAVSVIYDANPAHIIYECLTDTDWGMGADPSAVDLASFVAAGQTLYSEGFGMSLAWMQQSSVEDFVNDVLAHIKGALYPNPRTGKQTLRLLRDDLDTANLKEITPDNASLVNFSRKGWGETTNEIVVTWTNPDTEQEETVRMQDLANVAQQGTVISSSKNYHGIRAPGLALRVAERDLREESAPLASCEVTVNREFWDVVPFDGLKVTWPEYGLDGLVMRVMKVNYGDSQNSAIKLSLLEDVFSLPLASYVAPATGEWTDPADYPVPVTTARAMPAPAYVLSRYGVDLGALPDTDTAIVPLAVNPTGTPEASYDLLEKSVSASGAETWPQVLGEVPFPGVAELPGLLAAEVTTTGLVLANIAGEPPVTDELLLIGDDALPDDELELALVTADDPETGEITLRRGALDTVPKEWPAGTKVQLTREGHWRPAPPTYLDGQALSFKFLVETSAGLLEEYETPEFTGTAAARASLPTRPGNLRAFGELYPDPTFYPEYPVTISWSHRNRLLEDTVMLGWDEGDTPAEAGVTYRVLVEGIQTDGTVDGVVVDVTQAATSYVLTEAAVGPVYAASPLLRATVWAVRDGLQSWQAGEVRFRGPFKPPQDLAGYYLDPVAPGGLTIVNSSLGT